MKKQLFLLVGLLCLYSTAAIAASNGYLMRQCQRLMEESPPRIKIMYNYGALRFDRSKTPAELKAMRKKITQGGNTYGQTMGLTILPSYLHLDVYSTHLRKLEGSSTYCSYPSAISIKIGYKEPVIYLANNLQEGTCDYLRTLRHEMTHLDFGHIALSLFALELNEKFPDIVNKTGPILGSSDYKQEFFDLYLAQLTALFEGFKADLAKENSILDTDANYRKEGSLCR